MMDIAAFVVAILALLASIVSLVSSLLNNRFQKKMSIISAEQMVFTIFQNAEEKMLDICRTKNDASNCMDDEAYNTIAKVWLVTSISHACEFYLKKVVDCESFEDEYYIYIKTITETNFVSNVKSACRKDYERICQALNLMEKNIAKREKQNVKEENDNQAHESAQ